MTYLLRYRQKEVTEMSNLEGELNTITSTMRELAQRVTSLVESQGSTMSSDTYTELVAAERTLGALLRRLERTAANVRRDG
jgi:DNA replication initiation complex subunit (GINS family)